MTKQYTRKDTVPKEFEGLIGEFRGLLEKYPQAVQHFSIAYHPKGHRDELGTTTTGFTQPVFECTEIEPGWIKCERVDEQ